MDVRQVTRRTIEHVVVTLDQPYHQVQAALEAPMSILGNADELVRQFVAAKLSWDQIKRAIEERMGQSALTIFGKIEQGQLLASAGKPIRACQYAIGNPLLAIAMIEHVPEIALRRLHRWPAISPVLLHELTFCTLRSSRTTRFVGLLSGSPLAVRERRCPTGHRQRKISPHGSRGLAPFRPGAPRATIYA